MKDDKMISTQQDRLAALYEASARLTTTLDLPESLDLVMDTIIQLTGAERGYLVLQDEITGELRTSAARNVDPETIEGSSMQMSRTVVQRAVADGEPILTDNAQEDERVVGHQSGDYHLRAIMCAPLRARGQIIGAAYVDSRLQAGGFSHEDLELLVAFANQAATALENVRLHAEVQKANEARSEFVSLVTHELRIPMTSIRGYTDLLLGEMTGPLNETQKQFLDTIKRNLDRMGTLVGDLADINRIESGRMRFDLSDFDLQVAVQDVASDLREAIEAREQSLLLELSESPVRVHVDRARVTQILTNLISNAHKYSPVGGQITVAVRCDKEFARVDVADDGIGISAEDQERLFTQFFRGESALVREQIGWGLGLSIVKKLVEAQGGEVGFVSALGEGSTFTFTVPLAVAEGEKNG